MKRILLVALLLCGIHCYCQDASVKSAADTSLFSIRLQSVKNSRAFLYHLPTVQDQSNINKLAYLVGQKPNENNYKDYYKLACSFWQLTKPQEAEMLFLNIVGSREKFYTTTYRNSSDVPGDSSGSLYGYGSYTSNYKNGAALYLTKLYLEQKNFSKALQYLEDAEKKYAVTYTCGTGHIFQQEEYITLYSYCYEGLQQYNKVLDVLLPHFQSTRNEMLISTIKKLYQPGEIERYLKKAVSSMRCTFDTLPTTVIQSTNVQDKWDTITYYSARATINLFGRSVEVFPSIRKNGGRITREDLIKSFVESRFYQELIETKSSSQHTSLLQKKATLRKNTNHRKTANEFAWP